ncbi:P-loop containing nucleoside triphosphate hydrolase protein, partial [Ramicandelaber brevisporus]
MQKVALAVSIGAPVLVEGAIGTGKTALIHDLARQLGTETVMIHLGDQADSKALLGTYVSASRPGEFVFQLGVLARAVRDGQWVVFEDIDLAPADVLAILVPLIDKGKLVMPGRDECIVAHPRFRLLGTRRINITAGGGSSVDPQQNKMLSGRWSIVRTDALSRNEIVYAISQKYPVLSKITSQLVDLGTRLVDIVVGRQFSTMADSLSNGKLAHVVQSHAYQSAQPSEPLREVVPNVDARMDIFAETMDCFCGMLPFTLSDPASKSAHVLLATCVGQLFGLDHTNVAVYLQRVPSLSTPSAHSGRANISAGPLMFGRAVLSHSSTYDMLSDKELQDGSFTLTRHASRLLEQLAVSVSLNENVLLVGETGCGKTTVIQRLAKMAGVKKLHVVNMSQQSELSDLVGGFKPVDARAVGAPLIDRFLELMGITFGLDNPQNKLYVNIMHKAMNITSAAAAAANVANQPVSKKSSSQSKLLSRSEDWKTFTADVIQFDNQLSASKEHAVAFRFVDGKLAEAVKNGDWILLDEINLASPDTLLGISGILQDAHAALTVAEGGDDNNTADDTGRGGSGSGGGVQVIKRHSMFRLFACMNPATDVSKRDLPQALRSRFTEYYVASPDSDEGDLKSIIRSYLKPILHVKTEDAVDRVAQCYSQLKELAQKHSIVDGAQQRPHYSLRSLTRALRFFSTLINQGWKHGHWYGLRDAIELSFITQLEPASQPAALNCLNKIVRDQSQQHEMDGTAGIRHTGDMVADLSRRYRIPFGPNEPPSFEQASRKYIFTPTVCGNLRSLLRAVSDNRLPILIQGPTSAGKTSLIEHLAWRFGHTFVRINNHLHTDIQQYLGSYVANSSADSGSSAPLMSFKDALNRLLDDNREILIPETGERVTPHENFRLFATQNPAGTTYAGRQQLSRAFRNRFAEMHFDEIPVSELAEILQGRCAIAPTTAKDLVKVYKELTAKRQGTRLFDTKHGFITLRDMFRWANRCKGSAMKEEVANHGYMLLAERVRNPEEKQIVRDALKTAFGVTVDEDRLYMGDTGYTFVSRNKSKTTAPSSATRSMPPVAWTKSMRRLFVLVASALRANEPVLLVGEAGAGKTSVVQVLAAILGKELLAVNAHQNTEAADIIGGQRPVRQSSASSSGKGLFEWHDGPLVAALKSGDHFLFDEISLADDSVLERLNSVLESNGTLVLVEKADSTSSASAEGVDTVRQADGFRFLATMNPGGDAGKKELSPALRNRFTEIWVPSISDPADIAAIIEHRLKSPKLRGMHVGQRIIEFAAWLGVAADLNAAAASLSMRDYLAWVSFLDATADFLGPSAAFEHGGCLVVLDRLGTGVASTSSGAAVSSNKPGSRDQRHSGPPALAQIAQILAVNPHRLAEDFSPSTCPVSVTTSHLSIGPFAVAIGSVEECSKPAFSFQAPTTYDNLLRLLRGMQLRKPILLEGSPGVGKSSIVEALAKSAGHRLVRINLSDQSDLADLFGSDMPVEQDQQPSADPLFAWRDAPFLAAVRNGDWVLLDEANLAPQTVLEGLNSILDHRGTVFIPELGISFTAHPGFRVFVAQNPLQQGGGRKGLPRSFVDRFTTVYVDALSKEDLRMICNNRFDAVIDRDTQELVLEFNERMADATSAASSGHRRGGGGNSSVKTRFGRAGAPWEFNLRDVFRWLDLVASHTSLGYNADVFLRMLYVHRMRTAEDRQHTIDLFEQVSKRSVKVIQETPTFAITPTTVTIGRAQYNRRGSGSIHQQDTQQCSRILHSQLPALESLLFAVNQGFLSIVIGSSSSGKTSAIRWLAGVTGNRLLEFPMNSSVDTMELLGGFEQLDVRRHVAKAAKVLSELAGDVVRTALSTTPSSTAATSGRIVDVSAEVERVIRLVASSTASGGARGRFEWCDGVLIDAVENGHWLLVENANTCAASVLDRLNSLFELNGRIVVSERGLSMDGNVIEVHPHPQFRMFMTVDPSAAGELSRAMRNRGVEI